MTVRDTFIDIFGLDIVIGWDTRNLCGYDPQLLLADHRTIGQKLLSEIYRQTEPYLSNALFPRGINIDEEYIDFGPAEIGSLAHQLAGEMTAVVATGRMMRHREPTFHHTTIVIPADLTAFLEEGRDKLIHRIAESLGISYDQLTAPWPPVPSLKAEKPVAVKRSKGYLDHDPTKNHRRRRRK